MNTPYVHGYDPRESLRLQDQAQTLVDLLHGGTAYAPGSRVLEFGCGVGAQTLTLAQRSPQAHFTAIDIAAESVEQARQRVQAAGLRNVQFVHADLFAWPIEPASFDHVFVCFVLEHLRDPGAALFRLRTLLKPGGTLTVIEGDHGLVAFHPDDPAARAVIASQVELQRRAGGDAMLGRRLYPVLTAAGFEDVGVVPRVAYADASRPAWAEGFTLKTFTSMIEGVRDRALAAGLCEPSEFEAGVRALQRCAEPDGVFCYTFFKAVGRAP